MSTAESSHTTPSSPSTATRWYHDVAYLFGGMFLVNFVPHFVAGVSGSPFQSPFASPSGEGLSPALVNVGWGLANLFVAYLLLLRVGRFDLRRWRHFATFAVGFVGLALLTAQHFSRFHGGALHN